MGAVEELKGHVTRFGSLQEKHRAVGAGDTGPDMKFQWCLYKAFKNGGAAVPQDARGWSLYNMTGDAVAAEELATVTEDALRCIGGVWIEEMEALEAFIAKCCWRI